MKPLYVLDTHALVWHLQSAPELSAKARQLFLQIEAAQAVAIVPTIVLVEMIYLAEKKRLAEGLVHSVLALLGTESENYKLVPLDLTVVTSLPHISRSVVPDMPDRLIAATAFTLSVPLISRDANISKLSTIDVIW
jgi:PIN domain nuclease of toxin-antitoxin system